MDGRTGEKEISALCNLHRKLTTLATNSSPSKGTQVIFHLIIPTQTWNNPNLLPVFCVSTNRCISSLCFSSLHDVAQLSSLRDWTPHLSPAASAEVEAPNLRGRE